MADGKRYERPPGTRETTRKRRLGATVITVAVIALVFGFAIPRLGSYKDIFDTLGSLDTGQVLILLSVALACIVLAWSMYWLSLPYLGFLQAAQLSLSQNLIASTLPAGTPLSLGLAYEMIRSYGFDAPDLALMMGVSGIWNTFSKLALPVVSVVLLLATGGGSSRLVVLALIGVGVLGVSITGLALMLWRPSVARRLGDWAGRWASRILRPFKRGPVTGWGDSMVEFREQTLSVAEHRWAYLSITALAGQLATFWLFLLSVRYAGVTASSVSAVEVFAAFAFARLVSAVPITPGNLGISELSFIGFLVAAGGPETQAAAGVLLFRGLTYLLPLPLGVVTYLTWSLRRRRNPPGAGEPAEGMPEKDIPEQGECKDRGTLQPTI